MRAKPDIAQAAAGPAKACPGFPLPRLDHAFSGPPGRWPLGLILGYLSQRAPPRTPLGTALAPLSGCCGIAAARRPRAPPVTRRNRPPRSQPRAYAGGAVRLAARLAASSRAAGFASASASACRSPVTRRAGFSRRFAICPTPSASPAALSRTLVHPSPSRSHVSAGWLVWPLLGPRHSSSLDASGLPRAATPSSTPALPSMAPPPRPLPAAMRAARRACPHVNQSLVG